MLILRARFLLVGVTVAWSVAGCALVIGSGSDSARPDPTEPSAPTTASESESVPESGGNDDDGGGPGSGSVLSTPCFDTGPELSLPDSYIAADVSPNLDNCLFILQAENLADTTVIAGELWFSSGGNSFDRFVELVEEGLTVGQEPDITALQLLNTGASGRDLPIIDRNELASPNRAVIFTHESDRRDGLTALSAAVDAPAGEDGATRVIYLWGLSNPINDQLIIDLINSIQFNPSF